MSGGYKMALLNLCVPHLTHTTNPSAILDPVHLFQTALTILGTPGPVSTPQMNATLMRNGTEPSTAVTSLAAPSDLFSMITMLASFSALRDWLKILLVGGVIETCRRLFFGSWESLIDSFWITVTFDEDDVSYSESFLPAYDARID